MELFAVVRGQYLEVVKLNGDNAFETNVNSVSCAGLFTAQLCCVQ